MNLVLESTPNDIPEKVPKDRLLWKIFEIEAQEFDLKVLEIIRLSEHHPNFVSIHKIHVIMQL